MRLGRRRDITAIMAAAAVLAAALTSVANCANSCAFPTSACPSTHSQSEHTPCHHEGKSKSSNRPQPGKQCRYSASTLTARLTPQVSALSQLVVSSGLTALESHRLIHNQFSIRIAFSHPPPYSSGRTICRLQSLLRV